ncbi:acyl carrier protein [Amycolatopsis minnesotensis]|uniref:Carrier domain-containing protein n=1 Tax=Amycolatopsis minnesotensis TaxID=337894 RepID=A0ABN2QSW1_9PSEU
MREEACALVTAMAPGEPAAGAVDDGTRLTADLGYDSVRLVELAMALEQRFALPAMDFDELAEVRTVGDLLGLLAEHGGEG